MRRLSALLLGAMLLVGGGCTQEQAVLDGEDAATDIAPSSEQEAARPLIGKTETEALQFARERNLSARIGGSEDVTTPDSADYEPGRLTLVVRDDVVAEVIVETETGPVTVAAE